MNRAIFLALVIGLVCSQPDFELDEGVIILTEDNFDDVVNHFDHVLVMFYAPWCGHCKKLKPEYKAAATALADKGSEMRIGMVDATEHTALGSRFEVQGYPTLKFFIGGDAIEYNGPREKDGILNWLRKKTEPSTTPLGDSESVEKAKTDNEAVGVFFGGEDSEEFGLWKKITQSFDDMVFHHVLDADLAAEYGVDGVGVVLFKQFDEGRNDFEGEFTVDAVKKFVEDNSVPTIMKFDDKAAKLIFGGGKDCLFVFADDSDASAKALDAL
jgi:protein disulfide-isomerase A1